MTRATCCAGVWRLYHYGTCTRTATTRWTVTTGSEAFGLCGQHAKWARGTVRRSGLTIMRPDGTGRYVRPLHLKEERDEEAAKSLG